MKKTLNLTRRTVLKGLAGSATATGLVGSSLLSTSASAQAAEKSAVLVVFLLGGMNSLFNSADSFIGNGYFSVTGTNSQSLGNGLVVDRSTFGTLPAYALSHMATIGVRHGETSHGSARRVTWSNGTRNYALMLAQAMGGDAAIKCANIGTNLPLGPRPAEQGVSLQSITDMRTTIEALGGGAPNPENPDRSIAAKGLAASKAMSGDAVAESPTMLTTLDDGYKTAIDALNKPVTTFDFEGIATAYGHPIATTAVNNFRAQMVAAELMITAGANVVIAFDDVRLPNVWDKHADTTGNIQRGMMNDRVLPSLKTFINRMVGKPGRNVVVALIGEFSRSAPGSDHASATTATVIGKRVKVGSTGRVDGSVRLPPSTPGSPGFWAYLAEAASVTGTPFGPDPHSSLILPG